MEETQVSAPEEQSQELQDTASEEVQESTDVEPNVENDEVSESEPQEEEAGDNATVEGADASAEAEVVEEEEEFNPLTFNQQAQPELPQIPQIDPNSFIDENGQVDWATYNQAQEQRIQAVQQNAALMAQNAVQQATQQMELRERYAQEWAKAEDKFPELKGNKKLKDMVQAIHANSALTGKYLTPTKAAGELFGIRSESKAAGIKAATETRKVQAAAGLANPNPPSGDTGASSKDLKQRMTTGSRQDREAARLEYLKQIL